MRNSAVARNWPQVRLRNCRFAPNWAVLLGSLRLWETASATVLLIEIDASCEKAKTCPKHRTQLSCCWKLASKHSAHLLFCFKLTRIVGKPKPVKDAVQKLSCISNFAWNHTAQLWFCFKLVRIVSKLKLVRNSVRNSFFCSKLASKHSAQLSFCLELVSLIKPPDKIFSLFDL